MEMSKEEIANSLNHQQEILRALRQRLEQRELQEARQGWNTQPEIVNEIRELTERIQRHEAEIKRLHTQAAVDKEPLAEVEYRVALAQAWQPGRPTVAGAAQLELVRLRSGIEPERAEALEREVRMALVEEAFRSIDLMLLEVYDTFELRCETNEEFPGDCDEYHYDLPFFFHGGEEHWRILGRSTRLDFSKTVSLLSMKLSTDSFCVIQPPYTRNPITIENVATFEPQLPLITDPVQAFARWFRDKLALRNNISKGESDYVLFTRLADAIAALLTIVPAAPPPPNDEDEATSIIPIPD